MTMIRPTRLLGVLALLAFAVPALAQSPVGLWRTIDDDGTPKSLVRITEQGGEMVGVIERLLPEGRRCTDCDGRYQGSDLRGVRVLYGFTRDGDEYTGGRAFDPNNGRTYRGVMKVMPDGRLYLRGYVAGIRALGRTQYWERVR